MNLADNVESVVYKLNQLIGIPNKPGILITLNENLDKFNASTTALTELKNSLNGLKEELARSNFLQEWEMAKSYFQAKRPGPVSDDSIINWIASNRIKEQKNMKKCEELYQEKLKGSK